MTKQTVKKFSVLLLAASIVGVIISASLLKEDVLSTAHTLTVFFPVAFGVTPAMTEEGGLYLGIFISIAQIVGVAVASSKNYNKALRLLAALIVLLAVPFDAWTDIVFRSGYLSGNLAVATVTTIAFYTFGSEIMQALSLALFFSVWRQGLADLQWGAVYGWHSLGTMKKEFGAFVAAAKRHADRESIARIAERNRTAEPNLYQSEARPVTPGYRTPRPTQNSFFRPKPPEYPDDD